MNKIALSLLLLVLLPAAASAAEDTDAGYAWAEAHDISEESGCYDQNGGPINNSQSFTNGCLEFVRALEEDLDEDE